MGKNKFFDLAYEYYIASLTLYAQIYEAPYLYNPISYLLRHTIELLLKGLIVKELESRKVKTAINDIKIGKDKINAMHSVLILWNHYKSMSGNFAKEQFKGIDVALRKLDKKDFNSTRYRYPYKKSGEPVSIEPVVFDQSDTAPDLASGISYIIQGAEQTAIIERGRLLIQDISVLFDVVEFLFELEEDK